MKGKIHIGTSGWHYKHWVGTFYPAGTKDSEQLAYYIKFFKTVELNSPFYHLPPPKTFARLEKVCAARLHFRRESQPLYHPCEETKCRKR